MANLVAMLRLPGNLKSTQWQILAGPILILLILSMMVLPLPAFILDLLFTFNIALSIMVLLVAMFTQRTLEFAAFPTILLFTTLLRLALNVASTRIILMEGHTGAAAAGKVVEAFGHFLVGGNFAIGIVVFVILVIINFMVITKGAGRIRSIRKKFAQDMGFLPPVVHIRDNMDLPPARYRILMKGVEIGSGDAYPGRWLAINPGTAAGTLPGEQTIDPAFGLAAIWIESALKEQAQIQGYTVVEASTVVATHLNHLIGQFSAELFGRQEAQQLLDRVTQEMPKLTEDLVPGVLTLTTLHKVLQNLLDEKVPIRDMRTILETLAEHAPLQSDPHELTAVVRVALGRAITQQWFPGTGEVQVIGLDTPLERLLLQALQGGGGLEPGLADRLLAQTQEALARQEMLGAPPVLLVNHALRPLLSRFLRRSLNQLVVLSNMELSDNRHIRMTATIGGK